MRGAWPSPREPQCSSSSAESCPPSLDTAREHQDRKCPLGDRATPFLKLFPPTSPLYAGLVVTHSWSTSACPSVQTSRSVLPYCVPGPGPPALPTRPGVHRLICKAGLLVPFHGGARR